MQSKFWGDDSDESDYSSEYSSNGEEDVPKRQNDPPTWTLDSSSDDGESRVVKSAKAKAIETIQNHIKTIDHLKKISDFSELLKDYDMLSKLVDKQYSSGRLPKLIVKLITDLIQFMDLQQKDKESCKKFSKAKSIAFNTLRSRLRKFSEQYSDIIDEYNADPDNFHDILEQSDHEYSDSSLSSESDIDEGSYSEENDSVTQTNDDSGSDLDESSSWSDSGSSEVSDIDEDKHKLAMSKWGVKKTEKLSEVKEKVVKKVKTKVSKKKDEKDKQVPMSNYGKFSAIASAADALFAHLKEVKLGNDDNPFDIVVPEIEELVNTVHLTEDSVRSFVKSIIEKRGKRGTNNLENVRVLQVLVYIAKNISHTLYLEVLETLTHLHFDSYSYAYGAMSPSQWINAYRIAFHLLSELIKNPKLLLLSENFSLSSHTQNEEVEGVNSKGNTVEKLKGSTSLLSSIVQKLNDELYKGLLYTDVHHPDYKTMLAYTIDMLYLLHKTFVYFLKKDKNIYDQAATIALIILEHIHYKDDVIAYKIWDLIRKKVKDIDQLEYFFPCKTKKPSDIVSELVNFVFTHGTHREKIRACLHLAYNKSLHGCYYEARDLLLIPNLQEMANETDISTQILFNRNLAQLGICAFRSGLIREAHSYLMDICSQNRHKELLAQGLSNSKNQDKTVEQERAEKRRLLPHHMHLSIELIESVNNICALLLETANFAKSSLNNREIISRQFRRMFEIHEKQVFVGPPENNREIILIAFKYLQVGNWKECYNQILTLNTWNNMPDKENVQEKLKELIKIEAFRTYIFKYVSIYDSFSLDQLSSMFALNQNIIHSLISKMIVNGEIHASWDDNSKCCLINHTEPTELQKLAIKLAENLTTAVEQNELTLNMKNSKFALSQDRRFQQRDTKFSYNARHDDGRISNFNFNRNRRAIQSGRHHYKQSMIGTR
ncbi:eukaryotic translation initiation factor 3 subunit 8, putative [Theileria equi strain WA]|uniref:Eukaryotic translation initiation factor 3 subunit C n=1 Tax=Theileria equi strain WA TaxID=1537102 RepID=L0B141_THEEQ|nr:eukaryotic translation initiation factor 3 subunit 8, putative [Theileria equi strain WA]AFZ81582.1 eukaryotic translation initiation factor 3 subunit 8, putative [Theileria equi strain WA]|eukprot:XP_004831248.1 eukaryotic translation initiation factor 3 subunit 8, putative [Theileria equi strain WA]